MNTPPNDSREPHGETPEEKLTPWQIAFSALAAAFGVQSSRNRERDFSRGKPTHFIVAGLLFTVGFVIVMVLLVSVVLRNVGS